VEDGIYRFGSLQLNPTQRVLLDGRKPLRVGSRALELLVGCCAPARPPEAGSAVRSYR
jgi:hypothetical protein